MFRVDNDLNAIKGGGAAQLREKVLAEAAKTWVIVADYRKNSRVLGTNVSCLLLSKEVANEVVEERYPHRGHSIRLRQSPTQSRRSRITIQY
jgi:ribose 5-phosphate isomerase